MTDLAELSVQIENNVSEYERDMEKATKSLEKFSNATDAASKLEVENAKKVLASREANIKSIESLKSVASNIIKTYQDLATQTAKMEGSSHYEQQMEAIKRFHTTVTSSSSGIKESIKALRSEMNKDIVDPNTLARSEARITGLMALFNKMVSASKNASSGNAESMANSAQSFNEALNKIQSALSKTASSNTNPVAKIAKSLEEYVKLFPQVTKGVSEVSEKHVALDVVLVNLAQAFNNYYNAFKKGNGDQVGAKLGESILSYNKLSEAIVKVKEALTNDSKLLGNNPLAESAKNLIHNFEAVDQQIFKTINNIDKIRKAASASSATAASASSTAPKPAAATSALAVSVQGAVEKLSKNDITFLDAGTSAAQRFQIAFKAVAEYMPSVSNQFKKVKDSHNEMINEISKNGGMKNADLDVARSKLEALSKEFENVRTSVKTLSEASAKAMSLGVGNPEQVNMFRKMQKDVDSLSSTIDASMNKIARSMGTINTIINKQSSATTNTKAVDPNVEILRKISAESQELSNRIKAALNDVDRALAEGGKNANFSKIGDSVGAGVEKARSELNRMREAADNLKSTLKSSGGIGDAFNKEFISTERVMLNAEASVNRLAKRQTELKEAHDVSTKSVKGFASQFTDAAHVISGAGNSIGYAISNVLATVGLAAGFSSFVRAIQETAVELNRVQAVLEASATATMSANQQFDYLRNTAVKLGVAYQDLAVPFAKLTIAGTSVGASFSGIAKIFESVSRASLSLGMSTDQVRSLVLALEQMYSKGKVQGEELTRQMGNVLPGAVGIFTEAWARANNKQQQFKDDATKIFVEFQKAMRSGAVSLQNIGDQVAAVINERFGKAAEIMKQRVFGQFNQVKNYFSDFATRIFSSGLEAAMINIAIALQKILNPDNAATSPLYFTMTKLVSVLEKVTAVVRDNAEAFVKLGMVMATVFASSVAVKVVGFLYSLMASKLMLAITAVTAAIVYFGDVFATSSQKVDQSNKSIVKHASLIDDLGNVINSVFGVKSAYAAELDVIIEKSPKAEYAVTFLTVAIDALAGALGALTAATLFKVGWTRLLAVESLATAVVGVKSFIGAVKGIGSVGGVVALLTAQLIKLWDWVIVVSAALMRMIPVWGWIAAAIGAVYFALTSLDKSGDKLNDVAKASSGLSSAIKNAGLQAEEAKTKFEEAFKPIPDEFQVRLKAIADGLKDIGIAAQSVVTSFDQAFDAKNVQRFEEVAKKFGEKPQELAARIQKEYASSGYKGLGNDKAALTAAFSFVGNEDPMVVIDAMVLRYKALEEATNASAEAMKQQQQILTDQALAKKAAVEVAGIYLDKTQLEIDNITQENEALRKRDTTMVNTIKLRREYNSVLASSFEKNARDYNELSKGKDVPTDIDAVYDFAKGRPKDGLNKATQDTLNLSIKLAEAKAKNTEAQKAYNEVNKEGNTILSDANRLQDSINTYLDKTPDKVSTYSNELDRLKESFAKGNLTSKEYVQVQEAIKNITESLIEVQAKETAEIYKKVKAVQDQTDANTEYARLIRTEGGDAAERRKEELDLVNERQALANKLVKEGIEQSKAESLAQANFASKLDVDNAKLADTQSKRFKEIYKQAADASVGVFKDMYLKILDNGKVTWKDLFGSFKSIFLNAIAEMASVRLFQPLVDQLFNFLGVGSNTSPLFGGSTPAFGQSTGGILTAASGNNGLLSGISNIFSSGGTGGSIFSDIGSGINNIGTYLGFGSGSVMAAPSAGFIGPMPLESGSLFGTTTFGSALGAAGLGFTAGGIVSSLTGGNQLGGSIGGGLGAAAGMAIGGPIGGIIGGIGGSLLGGLFGPKKSVGPNANTNLNIRGGRLAVGETGADNGGDRAGTIQLAQQAVDTINKLFDTYSVQAYDPTGGKLGYTGMPHAMGFEVYTGNVNAGKPQTPDDVLNFMLKNGLIKSNASVNSDFKTNVLYGSGGGSSGDIYGRVLARTQAKTVADFAKDMDIAKFVDDAKKAATKLNDVQQSFKDLSDQIDDYVTRGAKLGVTMAEVYGAAASNLNLAVQQAIEAIENPQKLALDNLKKEYDARMAYAKKVGGDIAAIEKLYGLQRQQIVEQYEGNITETLKKQSDDLKKYMDAQLLGQDSNLTDYDKFIEAQKQLTEALKQAREAKPGQADLGAVTSAADNVLGLGGSVLGKATSEFAGLQDFTRNVLYNLGKQLGLPGFAAGTDFVVGGSGAADSKLAAFMVTPGERIKVSTPGQNNIADSSRGMYTLGETFKSEIREMRKEMSAINRSLVAQKDVQLAVRR